MKNLVAVLAFCLAGFFASAGWSQIPEEEQSDVKHWEIGFQPSYETGKFGTTTTTEVGYFPLVLKSLFSRGDLTLIVPYVTLRSTGQTPLVDGVPQRTRGAATTATTTSSGLGDIIFNARLYVLEEKKFIPTIGVVGKVKIPTASSSKGLGTGEFDAGGGVELSKTFIEKWVAYGDFYYMYIGDPPGLNLRNQFIFDLGAGYWITQKFQANVFYEQRTALVSGQPDPRSLIFSAFYKINETWRVNSSLEAGLSNGAPDFGLSAGVAARF